MTYKNSKLILLLSLVLSILASCISIHSDFTYYKEKTFIFNSKDIKLNGIYYSAKSRDISDYPGFIYLYNDGSIYCGWGEKEDVFWEDPNTYLNFLEKKFSEKGIAKSAFAEDWGSFIIRNDSIYIQEFYRNSEYWMLRNIISLTGIIVNDSIIEIHKENCSWCGNMYSGKWKNKTEIRYDSPIVYNLYQSSFKPDSTIAWFKQQSWYKEYLKQ
ncbi:MAG: hypothetical protein ABI763_03665 [Bacteroidota bacterium]